MISIPAAQAAKGELVRYRLPDPAEPVRKGVIVGTSFRRVFVRFDGDKRATLTNPEYLEWVVAH
jgi:hypothetical protein